MPKVKGCPFCGEVPRVECILKGTQFEAYFIKCENEMCECELKHPYFTEAEAVEAWNKRTEETVLKDISSCSPDAEENSVPEDLPMETLNKFKDEVVERFGERVLWLALLLVQMINKETWKFENYTEQMQYLADVMKFIEENEAAKTLFSKKG